ncbi:MAG: polymer-forming cytoskeletal protein [Rubrivivax sp.]|nr:polymer-forming cytoskeletal protein [Rubrivivax sp.]
MKTGPQDVMTIDPAAMNVVNRVSAGSHLNGRLLFEGGVLVQGELSGHVTVRGHLIVWHGATVRGRLNVQGDIYVFGHLGDQRAPSSLTSVECSGMVCVAQTGSSSAALIARRLQLYEGADVRGPFKTLRPGEAVPVLMDAVAVPT